MPIIEEAVLLSRAALACGDLRVDPDKLDPVLAITLSLGRKRVLARLILEIRLRGERLAPGGGGGGGGGGGVAKEQKTNDMLCAYHIFLDRPLSDLHCMYYLHGLLGNDLLKPQDHRCSRLE